MAPTSKPLFNNPACRPSSPPSFGEPAQHSAGKRPPSFGLPTPPSFGLPTCQSPGKRSSPVSPPSSNGEPACGSFGWPDQLSPVGRPFGGPIEPPSSNGELPIPDFGVSCGHLACQFPISGFGGPAPQQPPVSFGHPVQLPFPGFGGPAPRQSPPFGDPAFRSPPPFGDPARLPFPGFGGPAPRQSPPFGDPALQFSPPFGDPAQLPIPGFGGPAPPRQSPPFGDPAPRSLPLPPFGDPASRPLPPHFFGHPGHRGLAPPYEEPGCHRHCFGPLFLSYRSSGPGSPKQPAVWLVWFPSYSKPAHGPLTDHSALTPHTPSKRGGQPSMLPPPTWHPRLIQSNQQHSAGHFPSCHLLRQVELWRASVPPFGKPGSMASVPSFQNHDGHSCGECLFYDLLGFNGTHKASIEAPLCVKENISRSILGEAASKNSQAKPPTGH